MFCNEPETVIIYFFNALATATWAEVKKLLMLDGLTITYITVADLWNSNKKNAVANVVSALVLWTLWLIRNDMCFNRSIWHAGHM
jgi:hypothetical protein